MREGGKSNAIIWESFLAGDKEAFAHIYNLYVESMYRYGTKLCSDENLVKDAIQEIFLDLFLKRHKNKTNPENLHYYLILALKRNLIKKLKRNRKLVEEEDFETEFEPEYSIEKIIIEDEEETELNRRVKKVLSTLPAKQKEAIYLRFNESMEYQEIAQVLNISVESVRKQVYRALSSIRKQFGKQGPVLFLFNLKKS
ncbi:sigma-70 family RNA polymerase sigma factor [Mariniphaga sediminis]|jgi:RNA polymerase sigma factor (sigma-70 family)|uniref:Sigma-70 family RNA polymerase sigma factor n=1 Tax=Mariniphaga sediminis TaxID=1628158 RepID=A0A399CWY6_9BACT|nr:sigma-70 family RNA polymerase sigma factor [Mariniphaga sediminis]RIH62921.1 sigma-70 family RNA polymerase sigma factor [Mariniphaga sediminis]